MKKVNAVVLSIVIGIPIILLVLAIGPRHWPWDSAAELEKTRSNLSLAESRWKSHDIQDYDITVWTNKPGFCGGWDDYTILQVRHGQLVMTEEVRQDKLEEFCHISGFLPPHAFALLKDEVERSNPMESYLSIEFDSTYGFITRYHFDCNDSTTTCSTVYTFDNFKPIKGNPIP